MANSIINLRDNATTTTIPTEYSNQTINISKYGRMVIVSGEISTIKEIPAFTSIATVPIPIVIQDFVGYDGNKNIVAQFFINNTMRLASRKIIPSGTDIYFSITYISLY